MIKFIKRYWDIIGGSVAGLILAFLSDFNLESVQLYYSIILLILVSIGVFRIMKQAVDKQRAKKSEQRKHTLIDEVLDGQKTIKLIRLAQEPIKEGEKAGKLFMELWEVNKKVMKKIKTFFDKYKGYALTIALGLLTFVEQYGGYINQLCGGVFVVKGIEVIPTVTLIATIIVGLLSNNFTKEQMEKIKALFSKSTTDEIVLVEIKKTIKEKSQELSQRNKTLSAQEAELENLNCERETLNNTLQAKKKMCSMTPPIATAEDVKVAQNAVTQCETKIKSKQTEIAETKEKIESLTETINSYKSQLYGG